MRPLINDGRIADGRKTSRPGNKREEEEEESSEEEGNSKRVVEEGTHSSPNEDENGFSEEEIMRMIVNM